MATDRLNWRWAVTVALLAVVIIASGTVFWLRCPHAEPIEIVLPPAAEISGQIKIGGAVKNPGIYPLKDGDRIGDIIQSAGGTTGDADPGNLTFYVPTTGEAELPQKIDINRAEAWLLEALPGIGPTRAQAIVAYREHNGPFRNTYELTRVEGIGTATYDKIKHLVTVAD